jgi:hypothetical protein
MTARKYRQPIAHLIIGLYFGWFIWTALSNRPVEALSRYLPGRVAAMIWASSLLFLPVVAGVFGLADALRLSLAVLFLIFSALVPLAFHYDPSATVLVGAAIFIEGFCLARWKAERKRSPAGQRL